MRQVVGFQQNLTKPPEPFDLPEARLFMACDFNSNLSAAGTSLRMSRSFLPPSPHHPNIPDSMALPNLQSQWIQWNAQLLNQQFPVVPIKFAPITNYPLFMPVGQPQFPLNMEVPCWYWMQRNLMTPMVPVGSRVSNVPKAPEPIKILLRNQNDWKHLHSLTNEMLVKNGGRNMFPFLHIDLQNLIPTASYKIGVKLVLAPENKHFYCSETNQWCEMARRKYDGRLENETIEVFSQVQSGAHIQKYGCILKTVKIYNEVKESYKTKMSEEKRTTKTVKEQLRAKTMLRVVSHYKYIPVIAAYQLIGSAAPLKIAETLFPETEFVATTELKNPEIRKWKKERNFSVRDEYRKSL